ncbi:MAG: hypothetical protein JSR85_07765 [Proteobacteria bacterium]|nr:hypothetical protein [Pseudomonadota bacterium]
MKEEKDTPSRHPRSAKKTQELKKDCLALNDYPTQTAKLEESFTTALDLFEASLRYMGFLDQLIRDVKDETGTYKKEEKFLKYFGRTAVLSREAEATVDSQLNLFGLVHGKISTGLKWFLKNFKDHLNELKSPSKAIVWKKEVDEIINSLNYYLESEGGFKKELKRATNQVANRLAKSKFMLRKETIQKLSQLTRKQREDHIMDLYQDQIEIWSKVKSLFAPYSSTPPIILISTEEAEDIKTESAKSKRNKKRREAKRLKKLALSKKEELEGSRPVEVSEETEKSTSTFTSIVEQDHKKEDSSRTDLPERKEELKEIPSMPISQKEDKEPEVSTDLVPKHILEAVETQISRILIAAPHKIEPKKDTKKSAEGLRISKRNLSVLESVFVKPISDISMEDFDNMIESDAGFRGRVYGGKRSHLYEIFVLLNKDNKPSHFLSFIEYQKKRKMKENVMKYHFSLHRPHMRGKNKQRKTRSMYPALVEFARDHLQRFNLTPEFIKTN